MKRVLGADFFDRPTVTVARDLVGKYLVRKIGKKEIALMITETEAYDGPPDLGSHSSRGRTERTEVLFGAPGVWYVYFVYGMHEMLNVVTRRAGAGVLIRGVEGYEGPGRLTRALSISRELNKKPASRKTGLWIEDRGVRFAPSEIQKTPRIGIAYAGEWIDKPWRFVAQKKFEPRVK